MSEKPKHDPIIVKLKKLFALQERAGTEAEAVNAAARIQELLAKHNLEIGVLDNITDQEGVEAEPDMKFTSRINSYDSVLASAADVLMNTKHFYRTRYSQGKKIVKIVFVGLPANVEVARATLKYFQDVSWHLLDVRFRRGEVKGNSECRSYRLGVARRLLGKCMEFNKNREERLQKEAVAGSLEGSQCMALVRVGNLVATRYIDEVIKPESTQKFNYNPSIGGAYHLGTLDAKTVDIHGGSGNKSLRSPDAKA